MKKIILIIFSITLASFILTKIIVGVPYNPIIYIEKNPNDFSLFIEVHTGSKFDQILYEKKDDKYFYFIYQNGLFTNFNYVNYYKFKVDINLIQINNIKEGDYLSYFCTDCAKNIIILE
jgi:hypothetical protein